MGKLLIDCGYIEPKKKKVGIEIVAIFHVFYLHVLCTDDYVRR